MRKLTKGRFKEAVAKAATVGTKGRSKEAVAKAATVGALVTKREVADYLNVTTRTIENYMASGLPHYKPSLRSSRFDLNQVKEWFELHHRVERAA